CLEPMREGVDQLERPWHRGYRLQRVDVGEAGQASQLFIEARVVLHRAGAERVETGIDRVVLLRQASEMAHDLRLAEPGEPYLALPLQAAEAIAKRCWLGQVDA